MGDVLRNAGRFVKGVSGNPAGRPRSGEALAEYIRQLHGDDAKRIVDKLTTIIFDSGDVRSRIQAILKDAGVKRGKLKEIEEAIYDAVVAAKVDGREMLSAIGILLERGYGKPPQEIALTSGDDHPPMTKRDMEARLLMLLDKVRSSSGPEPAGPRPS